MPADACRQEAVHLSAPSGIAPEARPRAKCTPPVARSDGRVRQVPDEDACLPSLIGVSSSAWPRGAPLAERRAARYDHIDNGVVGDDVSDGVAATVRSESRVGRECSLWPAGKGGSVASRRAGLLDDLLPHSRPSRACSYRATDAPSSWPPGGGYYAECWRPAEKAGFRRESAPTIARSPGA